MTDPIAARKQCAGAVRANVCRMHMCWMDLGTPVTRGHPQAAGLGFAKKLAIVRCPFASSAGALLRFFAAGAGAADGLLRAGTSFECFEGGGSAAAAVAPNAESSSRFTILPATDSDAMDALRFAPTTSLPVSSTASSDATASAAAAIGGEGAGAVRLGS